MNYSTIRNTPIKIGLIFSVFTFLLYMYGPYEFPYSNKFILLLFLIVTNISMYLGFNNGSAVKIDDNIGYKPINIDKLLNVLFILTLIISIPKYVIYTGFYNGTISSTLNSILLFFSGSVQEVYNNKMDFTVAVGIWKYLNYLVVLLGPVHWAYTPITLYYWSRIRPYQKLGAILIWSLNILQYICTGTNVGLFEFVIVVACIYAIKHIGRKSSTKLLLGIIISSFLLITIFDFTMGSRIGDNYQYVSLPNQYCKFDENSIFLKFTPRILHPVIAYFTRYLAIPYYALDLSFSVPFKTTFGFGYSWFLLDNMGPLSNFLWDRTYMMQMERMFYYDHFSNWHTAYLWIANDVSHFGVPVVLYFIFYLFGKSWKEFICTNNIVSLLIFMLFVSMCLFISANNHIFQPSHLLFSFWILFFLRRISRRYIWPKV